MGAALNGLYQRDRGRYLVVAVGWLVFVVVLVTLSGIYGYAHFEGGDIDRYMPMAASTLAVLVVAHAWGLWRLARESTSVLAWIRDGPSGELAPEAWSTAVQVPSRVVTRYAQAGVAVGGTAIALAIATVDDSALGVAWVGTGTFTVVVWALFLTHPAATILIRPVLDEISRYLPAGFAPRASGDFRRITFRLMMAIIFFSFLAGAALLTAPGGGPDHGLQMMGIGVAFCLLVGLPASIEATEMILGPVWGLIASTERVAAGDLSARAPLLSDDELGRLARSHNEMLSELERRAREVEASRARIVAASDAARRAVERDLHDGAQQHLVILRLKLNQARKLADAGDPAATALLAEAVDDLAVAMGELRDLAHGIYPTVLESDGLAAALGEAVRRSPLRATLRSDGAGRYAPQLEAAVYFCCLEALQNAAKHAGDDATLTVTLQHDDRALAFEIADDGSGFEPTAEAHSAGLQNMADRIGALGGRLRIESKPGAGTHISGRVPL